MSTADLYLCGFCFLFIIACKKTDELPPQITLKGNDTVYSILNEPYIDPGVAAWDDTDGDLSSKVKISSLVNINKAGFYKVFFDAVDQAGNQALQQHRVVAVVHSSPNFSGQYEVYDTVFHPTFSINYFSDISIDSSLNNRMIISRFLDNLDYSIFFEVSDSNSIFPYQEVLSSININTGIIIQGSGYINDTVLSFSYLKMIGDTTYFCRQYLKKKIE